VRPLGTGEALPVAISADAPSAGPPASTATGGTSAIAGAGQPLVCITDVQHNRQYVFDAVYGPHDSNQVVFTRQVARIVQGIVAGYNGYDGSHVTTPQLNCSCMNDCIAAAPSLHMAKLGVEKPIR
jgi:hypothetical protein